MKIEVKGHSGCDIEIARDGLALFIEKSTRDTRYVPRLVAQFEKQQHAFEQNNGRVRIPQIYEIRKTDSFAVAKMEYIYSQNFIDYFETAGFEEIHSFIDCISEFIEKEIAASQIIAISSEVLLEKFRDVKSKVNANPLFHDDAEVERMMDAASGCFNALPHTLTLPVGRCHGDLTFSNILFSKSSFYLIDFLDSFIETPLMDIVKLRQDSAYGWSKLMFNGTFDSTRLQIVSTRIDDEIQRRFSKYDWYHDYYPSFQLMNFLRILQYAKEEKVADYLSKIINQLLKGGCCEL